MKNLASSLVSFSTGCELTFHIQVGNLLTDSELHFESWTYDTQTGQVAEMVVPETSLVPRAQQMLQVRATADIESREIYMSVFALNFSLIPYLSFYIYTASIPELLQSSQNRSRSDPNSEGTLATLWIYNIDANTWSPVIEPVQASTPQHYAGATASDEDQEGSSDEDTKAPRPRLGHSVVFDPSKQTFFTFGGNPGDTDGKHLNDFWSLTLNR